MLICALIPSSVRSGRGRRPRAGLSAGLVDGQSACITGAHEATVLYRVDQITILFKLQRQDQQIIAMRSVLFDREQRVEYITANCQIKQKTLIFFLLRNLIIRSTLY